MDNIRRLTRSSSKDKPPVSTKRNISNLLHFTKSKSKVDLRVVDDISVIEEPVLRERTKSKKKRKTQSARHDKDISKTNLPGLSKLQDTKLREAIIEPSTPHSAISPKKKNRLSLRRLRTSPGFIEVAQTPTSPTASEKMELRNFLQNSGSGDNNRPKRQKTKQHKEIQKKENIDKVKEQLLSGTVTERRKLAFGRLSSICEYSQLVDPKFLNDSKSDDETGADGSGFKRLNRESLEDLFQTVHSHNKELQQENRILKESQAQSLKLLENVQEKISKLASENQDTKSNETLKELKSLVTEVKSLLDDKRKTKLEKVLSVNRIQQNRRNRNKGGRFYKEKQLSNRGAGSGFLPRPQRARLPVKRAASATEFGTWVAPLNSTFDPLPGRGSAITELAIVKEAALVTRSLHFQPISDSGDDIKQILKSGKIFPLFEWIIERSSDPSDLEVFFVGFREFVTPDQLLDFIVEKCKGVQWNRDVVGFMLPPLLFWTKRYWDDFADTDRYKKLADFLSHPSLQQFSEVQLIQQQLSAKRMKRNSMAALEGILQCTIPDSARKLELLAIPPVELARQITLLEFSMFQNVNALDLVKSSTRERSPKIKALIQRFNRTSNWIATEILLCANVKKRASVIKHFILVAESLRELRNFNSLLEVTAGLNNASVQRLRKTWRLVPNKQVETFKSLEDLMDCRGNFARYRQTLASCDTPVFPYFGIFLRDCTFIDIGNESYVQGDYVNFEKMKLKGDVIRSFQRFQRSSYHFSAIHSLQNYLMNISAFEENLLHKYSAQYERAADI